MPAHRLNGVQRVLLALWVGGMWAIGYLAAPVLFASLDSRMQAGAIAGILFSRLAWFGLVSGVVILGLQWRAGAAGLTRVALWCVGLMLIITAVGQFGIQPIMAGLKAQVAPGAQMSGAVRADFGMWHGISSSLFLVCSLLGVVALWRTTPAR
ncbi:DUF4149 domain-containing protein [Nitrogeniibacter mangrovi]|uniref:DUF4149 domain-containing protein n=1 Tax=Nitrogeniibacter mangrovi TaxID=2016596 RepID=A0A6C1B5S5_9RHOO|nr:DUF4149 domain-containing protein [Nitrogeniibacter mangrovi]QID18155.1 DUF4149 domain-containing protein [Nitrogeniibacter mangrovi]